MLRELYIENLAIIEKAGINFDGAFNVFSGETGAGKSILIGGINAVLGGRVSKDLVRAGTDKAVITALFDRLPPAVIRLLREYGYIDSPESEDTDGSGLELTLTREISAGSGSSVARINGRPATASQLKEISAYLIDVHGQHETRMITSRSVQLQLIDSFGGIDKSEYESAFREFSRVSKKLKQLTSDNKLREEKAAFLSAKIADLEPYKLRKGEEEEVAAELNRLRHIKSVFLTLSIARAALNGDDAVIPSLNTCISALNQAAEYVPECKPLKERLETVLIETDDIKSEISSLLSVNESAAHDGRGGKKLSYYEERMSDFLRLRRKYGLSADELSEELLVWKSELEELQGGDEFLQKLTAEKKQLGDKVKRLAGELTRKRQKSADELSALICGELAFLDMPGTKLSFALKQENVTITGMDSAEMMLAVNKGEEPKPLSKIASGGELSRIMLAIKSVQATCKNETESSVSIFDEIDSGISGRAAHKVGLKLSQLSKERQVLCVTHLAQIAAMADNHILIEKAADGDRTYTGVRRISGEERKRELARIISGDEDEISLANAERLMNKANNE